MRKIFLKHKLLLPLFQYFNLVSSDSDDDVTVKKSTKSPKEKQRGKKEPPPKKDPVQYVSETGDDTLRYAHTIDCYKRNAMRTVHIKSI